MAIDLDELAARARERMEPDWNEHRERRVLDAVRRAPPPGRRGAPIARWVAVSAAAVAVSAALVLAWPGGDTLTAHPSRLELEDGSVCELESGAHLSASERSAALIRLIQTDGRVRYEVSHRPERTFEVLAAPVTVRVRGTRFSVDVAEETVTVSVEQGRVEVLARSRVTELTDGETLSIPRRRDLPEEGPRVDEALLDRAVSAAVRRVESEAPSAQADAARGSARASERGAQGNPRPAAHETSPAHQVSSAHETSSQHQTSPAREVSSAREASSQVSFAHETSPAHEASSAHEVSSQPSSAHREHEASSAHQTSSAREASSARHTPPAHRTSSAHAATSAHRLSSARRASSAHAASSAHRPPSARRASSERGAWSAHGISPAREASPGVERDPEALLAQADAHRRAGRQREAIAVLERFLVEHAGDVRAPSAAFTLGRFRRQLGEHVAAANAFASAYAGAPDGPLAEDSLAYEALSWAAAGESERAVRAAQRYLDRYPAGLHARQLSLLLPP